MEIEYDIRKSESNRLKHGISLEEAKALWLEAGVEIQARSVDEPRFLRIGKLGDKLYSCFFTIRGERIRLISARRSRPEEEMIYERGISGDEEPKQA